MLKQILVLTLLAHCPTTIGSSAVADEPAAEVKVLREISYREPADKHCTLDLAMPAAESDKLRPAIIVIHGGGWIEGDKSSFTTAEHGVPGNIVEFARLGFVAATINYRLAGVAPYPAALEDCRAAVRFLRANAQKYGIDPNRIGAYGNSAGGHLALLLALDVADDKAELGQSARVQAAVSDSGPLDLARQHRQNQLRTVVERFLGGPPEGSRVESYRRASPATFIARDVPPLLLIYGATDEQVDVKTADEFVAALAAAGAPDISYVRLAATGHCPHSLLRVPATKTIVNDFFVRTLQPSPCP